MAESDPHLRETLLRSEVVFEGGFLRVTRDTVRLPDGHETTREFIRHSGAAVIVPILDDGRLVLERQWRHPLGGVLLEFPAGKIDPGEAPATTAVRELAEETGYHAAEWAYAGRLHNAAAYSDERIEIFFARGLQPGPNALDHGEHIELVLMTEAEVEAAVVSGQLTDAKTLIGLLWLQKWRQGAWPLQWQPSPG